MTARTSISIAGNIGSGKSSVAASLSLATGWPVVSTGALFRRLAAERGLTVLELNQEAEDDRSIDDLVDGHLRDLAAADATAVIDSRMAWHFVPQSFKVYLVVDPRVAVERVHGAVRDDERYASIDEAAAEVLARQRVEAQRYHDLYGVQVDDWRNYDLVVDTSRLGIDETAELIASMMDAETPPTVCEIDPKRLIPSGGDEDGPVQIAVADGAIVVVSGHGIVRQALDRGDPLVHCTIAAFGDDEISALPEAALLTKAIEARSS